MADSNVLILHVWDLMAEYLINKTHSSGNIHPGTISVGNTGTLLPSVLQCLESETGIPCHIGTVGIYAKDAAFLMPFVSHDFYHCFLSLLISPFIHPQDGL